MFNRLRLKITLGTAFILGGFLFLLGMSSVNSQEEQLVENLRNHGHRIAALTARSSAEYIQRFSFFLMEDQAISIEQSPDIAFCEIYDVNGASLLQSGNIISTDHDGKRKAQYGSDILVVSEPILAGEKSLGTVEIGLRLNSIDKAIQEKTTDLAFLFLGFTVCVIIVINLFLNNFIIKPVLSLADAAQRVANREFLTLDEKGRNDEIGLLTKNFNRMSRVLESLYSNLERKVLERTQELEDTNVDLKAAVQHANEMAEKAEAGALAKSQFLASMSHEIRTPMNAVLGMGGILNESNLDAEQRRYVHILLEAGHALFGLIDDILDLSKIEAGEMLFEDAPFDLEDIVDKAFKVTVYAGHRKGLDMDYAIAPAVPANLRGDGLRLQQILINLLGNGIKFTDTGSVLLDINVDTDNPAENGQTMLHFCVRDSGAGIPADKLEAIFDTFTQADASTTRRHGGTGLGLSICRHLCENLGGKIWIESEPNKGCAVHFRLPYFIEEPADKAPFSLNDRQVLLIDSRPYAEHTLASRIRLAGAHVDLVRDLNAIETMPQDKGEAYDCVIISVLGQTDRMRGALPTLNSVGIEQERTIWLRSSDASQVADQPTVGTTITMPASVKEFDAALTPSLEPSAAFPSKTRKDRSPSEEELTILLVEDSEANRILIELYLKDSSHKLIMANNGKAALAQFKKQPVDVVLMDVEMPIMDGLECTRLLREWEKKNRTTSARIIALTAHALVEIKEETMAAGCNDFLTKPITRTDLLDSLDK